jgi:hypothetical protein
MTARIYRPNFLSGGPIRERSKPATVTRLVTHGPSASLRSLARMRHIEAVERLKAGDTAGFVRGLRDVDAIEEEARRARRSEVWAAEMARKVVESE